jgi:hypothetical protein
MIGKTLRSMLMLGLVAMAGCDDPPTDPAGQLSATLTASPSTVDRTEPVQLRLRVSNQTSQQVEFFVHEYSVFRVGQTTPLITRPVDGAGLEDEIVLSPGESIDEPAGEIILDDRFTAGQYEVWVSFSGVEISARASFRVR